MMDRIEVEADDQVVVVRCIDDWPWLGYSFVYFLFSHADGLLTHSIVSHLV